MLSSPPLGANPPRRARTGRSIRLGLGLATVAAGAALLAPASSMAAGGCGGYLWQTSIGYAGCTSIVSGILTHGMQVQNNLGSAVTISVQIAWEKDATGLQTLAAKTATVPNGGPSFPYNSPRPGVICARGHKYRGWARVKLSNLPNWGSWAPGPQLTCT